MSTIDQPTPPAPGTPQIIYVQSPSNVPVEREKVNHGLHLFLTIITFGMWLPVWLILAVAA